MCTWCCSVKLRVFILILEISLWRNQPLEQPSGLEGLQKLARYQAAKINSFLHMQTSFYSWPGQNRQRGLKRNPGQDGIFCPWVVFHGEEWHPAEVFQLALSQSWGCIYRRWTPWLQKPDWKLLMWLQPQRTALLRDSRLPFPALFGDSAKAQVSICNFLPWQAIAFWHVFQVCVVFETPNT